MQDSRNVVFSRDFGPLDEHILIASTMSSSEELQQSGRVEFREDSEARCRNLADTAVTIHFFGMRGVPTWRYWRRRDIIRSIWIQCISGRMISAWRRCRGYSNASNLEINSHVLQEQWFQSLRSETWLLRQYLDAFEISCSGNASRVTFDVCISLIPRPSHRQRRSYREAKIATEQQQWTLYVHRTWKQQRKDYE